MQTKLVKQTRALSLLLLVTLALSGCSETRSPAPEKIAKQIKHDIDTHTLKKAIIKAADKHEWKIAESASESISLSKTYVIKKRELSSLRVKRRYKPEVENTLAVNIDIADQMVKINPSSEVEATYKKGAHRTQIDRELAQLEKAINSEIGVSAL